jgi:hypothetical protein
VSAKVRAFTEFLQKEFEGEPAWDRWMTIAPPPALRKKP